MKPCYLLIYKIHNLDVLLATKYLKNVNGSILINVVTVYSKVQSINIKLQWTIFINPG